MNNHPPLSGRDKPDLDIRSFGILAKAATPRCEVLKASLQGW
jgi:hypothetical protein